MSRAATGESRSRDSAQAGRDAARHALEGLGGRAHAVLVFATAGYDQRVLLDAIGREVPNAALAGCSGSGVITRRGGSDEEHRYCVSVLAICSDAARFKSP
ncbi:MAG: hypothetical protein H6720_00425 [Sandaracinus sp.]|nr:hypothetical protein [Sandaracinus sp.]